MTALALLIALVVLVAVLAWVRPRAFDPQLREPHNRKGGDDGREDHPDL